MVFNFPSWFIPSWGTWTFCCDFLKNLFMPKRYPGGFDILMDDGSHVPEHQFTTFVHMWSAIKPGGVLMIEDVHGTNPLLKWLLEGHQNAHAKLPGLYYPMGNVGPPNDISRQAGNFLNNYGGKMNMASRIQMEVECLGSRSCKPGTSLYFVRGSFHQIPSPLEDLTGMTQTPSEQSQEYQDVPLHSGHHQTRKPNETPDRTETGHPVDSLQFRCVREFRP